MTNQQLPNSYDEWRTASHLTYPKMQYKFLCEDCSNPVYEGDKYVEIDGLKYCLRCLDTSYRQSTEKDEDCSICGMGIMYDELAYNIHGKWICEDCKQELEQT